MKRKMTKEQKRMDKKLEKIFNEIADNLFPDSLCPEEDLVVLPINFPQLREQNPLFGDFLYLLGIKYVMSKDAGEYTEVFWLTKNFSCIFITNNAM
jgi:hypothetical protein